MEGLGRAFQTPGQGPAGGKEPGVHGHWTAVQVSGRCPAGVWQVADRGECTGSGRGEPCWVQLNPEVLKHWDFTLRHMESP